jgi:DNA-binding NarL/FixJ family response regulator
MPADILASLYRQAISSQIFSMLSRKERLIVAYVLQNWKTSDIAAKMQTTEQTVKNHLRSVYRKTGTFDRLSLALFAAQNQLFPSNLLSDTA